MQDGLRENIHGGTQFNSFSLHSHSSKRSLPLHASYCCMWLICFPFSTAKVKQVSNVYKKVTSSITGASNNTQVSRIHRHSSKKHFHYVIQATTYNSQEFINIQTRHNSKQTNINMYCFLCIFNNFVNIITPALTQNNLSEKIYLKPNSTHQSVDNRLTLVTNYTTQTRHRS